MHSESVESGILDYQSRVGKRSHLTFPPFLPDDNDRANCFALSDAALRLGYKVSPKAGSMFPQPGVRDVVFTLSKVCPGRCFLGGLWGTDDEPTLVDRFAFSDLEIAVSPVLRNNTNYE